MRQAETDTYLALAVDCLRIAHKAKKAQHKLMARKGARRMQMQTDSKTNRDVTTAQNALDELRGAGRDEVDADRRS